MRVPAFPIVLNQNYTCQGWDARGRDWYFDDLLREGQMVELRGYGVDGRVVLLNTGDEGEQLCVVAATSPTDGDEGR